MVFILLMLMKQFSYPYFRSYQDCACPDKTAYNSGLFNSLYISLYIKIYFGLAFLNSQYELLGAKDFYNLFNNINGAQ